MSIMGRPLLLMDSSNQQELPSTKTGSWTVRTWNRRRGLPSALRFSLLSIRDLRLILLILLVIRISEDKLRGFYRLSMEYFWSFVPQRESKDKLDMFLESQLSMN